MVDVKISELPVAGSAAGTDQLEANQAGTSRSITVAQVGTTLGVAAGAPYLLLTGGTLTGPGNLTVSGTLAVTSTTSLSAALTGTAATFTGNATFTGSSATGGHVLYTDTNTGGQTWQTGPGAGSGSPDEWVVYNQTTAIKNISLQKTGTVVLAGGLSGTVATFTGTVTGTTATFNAGATTPAMRVTGNDAVLLGLFNGATKGVRFTTDASQVKIEGVDNTGVGSFQPLTLGGSIVQIGAQLSGTTAVFSGTVSAPGAQVQMVSTETGAVATGSTIIPVDDTIPQITEGNEYMTCVITPKSATSKLVIEVKAHLTSSVAGGTMVAALFQDATASALACSAGVLATAAGIGMFDFSHVMTSGTTSATTFRVRAGNSVAATTTFNGSGGARFYGGAIASSIVIREIT